MPRERFSAAEARRIAIRAQGLDRPRPVRRNSRHITGVVERLGLLQLDFVNVLLPAHKLVVYSRIGPYELADFDRAVYGRGRFTEHWAHEASIVPVAAWPLLRYRRERYRPWRGSPLFSLPNYRRYLQETLEIIKENGATTANDLPPVKGPPRRAGDWHRSVPRCALEHHFGHGHITVSSRLPNFQRVYDLPERIVPAEHIEQHVPEPDARRKLLRQAVDAMGIATTGDLADYYRMTARDAAPRLAELASAGAIRQVVVDGWREPAWLAATASVPRRVDACALLSPFDPLVWYRPRAERLFDFHYRIEIYVPEHKRRWGYYVLPFLCGESIAARVDLKADRGRRRLLVRAAHLEPEADPAATAERLTGELAALAAWLGLDDISVGRRGNFATTLSRALRARQAG